MLNNDVTATDNCTSNLTITQDPVAGTQPTVGTYTISFEATDDEGNTSTCSLSLHRPEELGVGDYTLEKGVSYLPKPCQQSGKYSFWKKKKKKKNQSHRTLVIFLENAC